MAATNSTTRDKGMIDISRPAWRPVSPDQPDEPVLFFSPDPDGNVPGGMIWVSGGQNGYGGWRNEYAKPDPTLYVPLKELAP